VAGWPWPLAINQMDEITKYRERDGTADQPPDASSRESGDQYKVKLEFFEGPLDLLLYLIKKDEVSIYDIPIARITEQYLDYLIAMQELDIAVAGEFLLMAATLIHIKSQMLLPRDPDQPEESAEDPRDELVHQLIEHQKFKAAANSLYQRATIESATFTRAPLETDANNPEISATAFQLFELFRDVLSRKKELAQLEIARDEMTMAEKIAEIKAMVGRGGKIRARDLFEAARSKREMVLIFLGILELVKELALRLVQNEQFGEIILLARAESDRSAEPLPGPQATEAPEQLSGGTSQDLPPAN
jgi:segregation and condensation protein A